MPSSPVEWTWVPPYADTRIGSGVMRAFEYVGKFSAPTADYAPEPAPPAECAYGWTDLALVKGRSFFGLIPRPPQCIARLPQDTPTTFIGVPGTKLGFAVNWSLFLPQKN